ncbi:hypothetical protein Tco_0364611 [Tanacetum coccineum]
MPLTEHLQVGGPSTAVAEGHYLILLAPGVPVPSLVIGELVPSMSQQAATQKDEVISGLSQQVLTLQVAVQHRDVQIQQLQTMVAEMSSCEGTLMQCILIR